ncbi:MAG: DUF2085 domain-containing protein [Planctomycetes bacterium]|nr:DUF2085 domain-containing protein [Planctomycetota bacterium]
MHDLLWRLGGYVCHQDPARSFHLFGRQCPVCIRCTGAYAALLLTLAVLALFFRGRLDRYPSRWYLAWIVFGVGAVMLDGGTGMLGWRESNNTLRLVTGALFGNAVALLAYPAAVSLWKGRRKP